eukprot:356016-Chlamydomonas_euryale.AAC.4
MAAVTAEAEAADADAAALSLVASRVGESLEAFEGCAKRGAKVWGCKVWMHTRMHAYVCL